MVTDFDISQEIFLMDMLVALKALKSSLKHRLCGEQALKLVFSIKRLLYKL